MANNIQQSLETLMRECHGAIYVILVDHTSGMLLGQKGGGELDLELLAAGTTEIIRSDMKAAAMQGNPGAKSHEILFSQKTFYHVLHHLKNYPGLYLAMGVDRQQGNLALLRRKLADMDQKLMV